MKLKLNSMKLKLNSMKLKLNSMKLKLNSMTVWRWWYALRPVSHHLKVVCYLLSVLASLAFYVVFRPISPEHFETPGLSLEMLFSFTPLIMVTVLAFWVPWARRDILDRVGVGGDVELPEPHVKELFSMLFHRAWKPGPKTDDLLAHIDEVVDAAERRHQELDPMNPKGNKMLSGLALVKALTTEKVTISCFTELREKIQIFVADRKNIDGGEPSNGEDVDQENPGPLKVFLTSLIFFLTLLIRLVFWGLVTLLLFSLFSPVLRVLLFEFDIRFWGLFLIFLVLHVRIE